MKRDLTPWLLAAMIAVASACGDDEPTACTGSACDEEDVDAGGIETRNDAAIRDARTPTDHEDARTPSPDAGPTPDAAAPTDASASDAGAPPRDAASGDDALESLRQACVDTINMYRATKSLPPMMRASAESESCSDDGAEFDSTANKAHGSAAKNAIPCRTSGVAQNTCPNWPARNGSVEAAMKQCLAQMWAEGEPPGGIPNCKGECFQAHGHYINMVSGSKFVSCGFFENTKKQWWMNQDFTSR